MAYACEIGRKYYFNSLTSAVPFLFGGSLCTFSGGGLSWTGGAPSTWNWETQLGVVNATYGADLAVTFTIIALPANGGIGLYNSFPAQFAVVSRSSGGVLSFAFPGQGNTLPTIASPVFPMKVRLEWTDTVSPNWTMRVYINDLLHGTAQPISTFNGSTYQSIDIAGYGASGQVKDFQIENSAMPLNCEGFAPVPWPVVESGYSGNPFACPLGKKTSWFLDEFSGPTVRPEWSLVSGVPVYVNGYCTPYYPHLVNTINKKWQSIPITIASGDHLTIELRGHIDQVNLPLVALPDAIELKIAVFGISDYARCLISRDASTITTYHIRTVDPLADTNQSSFTISYPFFVNIRAEVYADEVQWFVNNVLVHTYTWINPISRVVPEMFASADALHRGYLHYFYLAGTQGLPHLCLGTPASGISKYRNMLINLLPFGSLWRNLNELFQLFLEAFAVEPSRVHTSSDNLLREANPGTSTLALLLPDWERMALLPEEMPIGGETEAQRQQVVAAKLSTVYTGQSRQFFIDLAAKLGIPIAIQEGGYVEPARVGTARVGTARVNSAANVFIWNVQFLIDAFDGVTPYWAYDGDEDLITYPGYLAALAPATSTFLTFQGGPLFPTWPILSMTAAYPVIINITLRCIFSGVVNRSFMVNTWATDVGFSGDFVQFNFFYSVADGTYQIDLSGTQSGSPYAVLIDTGIELVADVTFRFNITIDPFGFVISMPENGVTVIQGGFDFPTLEYMDFSAQRPNGTNQGMFGGIGVYTNDPTLQFAKLKKMIARLKPAHTDVTYT